MADKSPITVEGFDTLLRWLDSDREIAGQKYQDIRLRLVRTFLGRGCPIAEELADETIDRVIKKCGEIIDDYQGDPIPYFYGVALRVFFEWTRRPKTVGLPAVLVAEKPDDEQSKLDAKNICLEECLGKLVPAQRELIVSYYDYSGSKRDKINRRKQINEDLGITSELLRIRIHRTRITLRNCIRKCMEKRICETF